MNRIVRQALTAAVVDGMVGVVPASAVAGPIPKTVLSVTGSGDRLLPAFTIPASAQHWRLTVSYDCSKRGLSGYVNLFSV